MKMNFGLWKQENEMSEKYDLIIRNAAIYTMDQERRMIDRGSLAVRGDRIAIIGHEDPA